MITNSASTVPIAWWWERVSQVSGYYSWHAAALMVTFLVYMVGAFVEMIAWCLYIDSKYDMARIWFPRVGYWMAIFGYPIPIILEIVQLVLRGSINFPGSWSIYHMVISFGLWIYSGLSHILYIDPFISFIDAREPSTCECSAPEVLTIAEDAN